MRSCPNFYPSCSISVTLSGSANGLGGSVSYTAQPIWSTTLSYPYTCGAQHSTSGPCPPNGHPPTHPAGDWTWDYTACTWVLVCDPDNDPSCGTPVIIDTSGTGFELTSAADGVKFDIFGTGQPIQVAWTAADSKNGWLVLPKDGKITSGRDMFGNITAQYLMNDHPPNGFAALSVYDGSAGGGNENGRIDPGDAIWGQLRVWIDANHDGISQTNELYTLDSLGIDPIDFRYTYSERSDKNGNQFRFKGHLAPANQSDEIDRKIFDVFLTTE